MLFIFLYGVLFYKFPWFQESLERNLNVALGAGAAISICYLGLYFLGYRFVNGYNLPNLAQLGLNSLATLCWLIVLSGFAQRILNFSNHFLDYASEAVLPIYIIHQTIIIVLGYYVVGTELNLITKFTIINILSFIIIMAIYDIIVRRFYVTRILVGMRPIQKKVC
jgi:peptidoglycan/LPS O-acetylase OafA/YrhL